MKAEQDKFKELFALRQRAEAVLGNEGAEVPSLSPEEARHLLHELHTHQIELEMQNEELREALENLMASRDKYSDLYDFAPVGYLTVSDKGVIIEANLTFADMVGVERRNLIRQALSSFIFDEDQDSYYRYCRDIVETKGGGACDLRMLRVGGETFWAKMECFIAGNPADGVQLRYAVSDISERKRAEMTLLEAREELARKEKLAVLGRLTATVSHEMRNPLGTLRMAIFSIREQTGGQDERVDRALDRAEHSVLRCDSIIDELLDYTRIQDPNVTPTAIDDWLAEVLDEIDIPEGVRLTTELSCGLEVSLDRERFRRCVVNVVTNACQAMVARKDEKEVTVETRVGDGRLEIVVKDTGIGIPADQLEKVFEPLYSTKSFGVGLGLSIVKQIAEQHGGHVEIESREGKGTVVTLSLPLGKEGEK